MWGRSSWDRVELRLAWDEQPVGIPARLREIASNLLASGASTGAVPGPFVAVDATPLLAVGGVYPESGLDELFTKNTITATTNRATKMTTFFRSAPIFMRSARPLERRCSALR